MDRFSIVDTYYWWLADHHEGQGSRKYARLSKITSYYSPGAARHAADDPIGYAELCHRNGCAHEWMETNEQA
jgi:hypothetical protein